LECGISVNQTGQFNILNGQAPAGEHVRQREDS